MAHTGKTRRELLGRPAAAVSNDTARLQRLLSIELLLLYTYEHVLASPVLERSVARALAPVRVHEQTHVLSLRRHLAARGGQAPSPPRTDAVANRHLAHRRVSGRIGQLRGQKDALNLLLALERVTVGAYFVALIKLRDPALITLAAQIMASDAQHEAIIGLQMNPGDIPSAVPYPLVQGVQ